MAKKSEVTLFIENSPIGRGDVVEFSHIYMWCKENDKSQWLKDYKAANPKFTFFQLRKAFYEEFFPARVPAPKEKKPTMYDLIDAM